MEGQCGGAPRYEGGTRRYRHTWDSREDDTWDHDSVYGSARPDPRASSTYTPHNLVSSYTNGSHDGPSPAAVVNVYRNPESTSYPSSSNMSTRSNEQIILGAYSTSGTIEVESNPATGRMSTVIRMKDFSLYPSDPKAPPPTTRKKPMGCKTVFVGGLPENTNEDILKEIFKVCGEIFKIRMSKKNFCHIRFASEEFVDVAISLSGYRLKIGGKDDAQNNGRLHVDYAQARDDQHEYNRKERALERALHQRITAEKELRSPSPPIIEFSDMEVAGVRKKLRSRDDNESISNSAKIIIAWLEQGVCNRGNSGQFFSVIKSASNANNIISANKAKYIHIYKRTKDMLNEKKKILNSLLTDIYRAFASAGSDQVRNNFVKQQQKYIDQCKGKLREVIEDPTSIEDMLMEQEKLSEENGVLRLQLLASENELEVIKCDMEYEEATQDSPSTSEHETNSEDDQPASANLKRSSSALEPLKMSTKRLCRQGSQVDPEEEVSKENIDINAVLGCKPDEAKCMITEREVHLVGLISFFLHIHRPGVPVDYIASYLQQTDKTISVQDVEMLLAKFAIFKDVKIRVNGSLIQVWKFRGFKKCKF